MDGGRQEILTFLPNQREYATESCVRDRYKNGHHDKRIDNKYQNKFRPENMKCDAPSWRAHDLVRKCA